MPIYFDKKTKRLFVQFMFRGETIKRRMPDGTTKAEAARLETKLKHDLFFDNKPTLRTESMMWEQFADRVYLEHVAANQSAASLEKAIYILKASMSFLKGKRLDEIKPADLERFKTSRINLKTMHGHERRPATVHREMSVISAVFSLAIKNDECRYNPCSRVTLPKFDNVQNRILSDLDVDRFLAAFRNGLQRDICTVVLYTGLRQNDILGLTKDAVDWQRGTITLVQGKTRRQVTIHLHPRVADILSSRLANGHDLFFPSYRTGRQLKSIKNAIRFACIRAGIEPLTIRDLRRTFGTQLHESGFDDKTVADCLGHSDLRSVHRYKRGTRIQKTAILSLEYKANSAKMPTSTEGPRFEDSAEPNKTLVEMRRIELLASALRTPLPDEIVH